MLGFLTSITALSTVNNLGCCVPSSLKCRCTFSTWIMVVSIIIPIELPDAKRHQICAYSNKLHHNKCGQQRKGAHKNNETSLKLFSNRYSTISTSIEPSSSACSPCWRWHLQYRFCRRKKRLRPSGRTCFIDFFDFSATANNVTAICAAQHHDNSANSFVFAVLHGRAHTHSFANLYVSNIPYVRRCSVLRFQDNFFYIANILSIHTTDDKLIGISFENIAADVLIIVSIAAYTSSTVTACFSSLSGIRSPGTVWSILQRIYFVYSCNIFQLRVIIHSWIVLKFVR